ncbi:glycoside hydrolase family 53 protein [Flavilitoribacter nigricans]|nr:glycosyl hydrolase 53 family protein [Flavilitoribacter nigricans]
MRTPFYYLLFILLIQNFPANSQSFYFGNDLSYVNEMEDCGVVYKEGNEPKDPYAIFADHGSNLVRLRLWHTPAWYDDLNESSRYSDLADVKRSITRARAAGMDVLLDFHLSDNWADPGKQLVPAAWLPVVDDLPLLQDSLYNYVYSTLAELKAEGLLPELVQIGNETNKGILLSPEDNATYTLEWDRNAALFNTGIRAVRDLEAATGDSIQVVIHAAGPDNADWIFDAFINNGVTDFDIMGISYYWAWHKPTTIDETGTIIRELREQHPGYEVMIMETGYLWTTEANDQANNIISETDPNYDPVSPESQKAWLIDLTQSVLENGGLGVIYWEPAWVSSSCSTQWGQGSHQEHATFFDFDYNLLENGGIAWMEYPYVGLTDVRETGNEATDISVSVDSLERRIRVNYRGLEAGVARVRLSSNDGRMLFQQEFRPQTGEGRYQLSLPAINLSTGIYRVTVYQGSKLIKTVSLVWK